MDSSLIYAIILALLMILIPHIGKRWADAPLKTLCGIVGVVVVSVFVGATAYHRLFQKMDFLEASLRGIGQALTLAALLIVYLKLESNASKKKDKSR